MKRTIVLFSPEQKQPQFSYEHKGQRSCLIVRIASLEMKQVAQNTPLPLEPVSLGTVTKQSHITFVLKNIL